MVDLNTVVSGGKPIPITKLNPKELSVLMIERLDNIRFLLVLSLGANLGLKFVNSTLPELLNAGLSFGLSASLWYSIVLRIVQKRSVSVLWYFVSASLTLNGLVNFVYQPYFSGFLSGGLGDIVRGLAMAALIMWLTLGEGNITATSKVPFVKYLNKMNGNKEGIT